MRVWHSVLRPPYFFPFPSIVFFMVPTIDDVYTDPATSPPETLKDKVTRREKQRRYSHLLSNQKS